MLEGDSALSRRFFATELIEHLVLCLNIICGVSKEILLISVNWCSFTKGIQFISYKVEWPFAGFLPGQGIRFFFCCNRNLKESKLLHKEKTSPIVNASYLFF